MTYSQKSIAAFLFAAVPLAYACKTSDATPTNRVALRAYQSARLQNDVTVRVDSLTDSRCPEGLVCIWAGNAVVKATLSKDTDQKQVRLVLGPDVTNGAQRKSDSTGVVLSGATYKVILRDVTPYPTVNQPSSAATQAVIDVTKL
ncbi:hypothetical protein [Fibrella forsythiae]|uniref:Lipoprotein n=1 Tax=Fibrella forsythiae TaxID=2817061 RepID=A0ABS3JGB7_9BACT|nr:hypothetical protein [Fibrella forsythiae]MBO0949025.1 hypothetical protein [Fibrella forsythiae]